MRRHSRHGSSGAKQAAKARPTRENTSSLLLRQFETSRPVHSSPLAVSAVNDMPLDLLERIRAFPLFSAAPDSFLAVVASYLRPQLFGKSEQILNEGEEAKAMYFLVRGAVAVMSRDGESTFAELKPGSFFGEIGILMDMPRSASVVARFKTLVVRLNKEDLRKVLPHYPDVEKGLREEAQERLAILNRLKYEKRNASAAAAQRSSSMISRGGKRTRDHLDGENEIELHNFHPSPGNSSKKRKSPSPAVADASSTSALGSGTLHVRQTLKQLPLFQDLPDDVLHFLGLNAQPRHYPPFTKIISQGLPGREVFFITSGHVEVFTEDPSRARSVGHSQQVNIRARLGPGEYFGEVVSLALSSKRTATVRSVVQVECLTIPGEVLDEFWLKCSPELRQRVEDTARARLNQDSDVKMLEDGDHALAIGGLAIDEADHSTRVTKVNQQPPAAKSKPVDPDPFRYPEKTTHRRHRSSRRSSLTNTPAETSPLAEGQSRKTSADKGSPWSSAAPTRAATPLSPPRPRSIRRKASSFGKGLLPDKVIVRIFQQLNVGTLMKFRRVSMHWARLLNTSTEILNMLNLSPYNHKITDQILINRICPFVGQRPRTIVINDCHHIGDEGFLALITMCGANVERLLLRSAWDISPQVLLELTERTKNLIEIDFSNVRKVSDNLLGLMFGLEARRNSNLDIPRDTSVRGCFNLSRVRLSYCKSITDRLMHMIAACAASRLESLDLTRCTAVTDAGFRYWASTSFSKLKKLVLADCTYLSDAAIYSLAQSAKSLQELDIVSLLRSDIAPTLC